MFDDTFVEELVARRPTVWTVLVRVGLVLVGVLFTLLHALIQAYVLTMLTALFYGEVSERPEPASGRS